MIHWIQGSKNKAINRYIECYWFIEKAADSNSYAFPKLNPDPSCHLIISPPNQAYQYDIQGDLTCGEGCHWLFPHHQTIELDHQKPFVHLGIKFHVGALYALKRDHNASDKMDCVEGFNTFSLFGNVSVNEQALISMARHGPDNCCDALDKLLLPWLEEGRQDKHSELVRRVLPFLAEHNISALSDKLHCSQRTLERSFNRVTGLTLKQCQAMNKLEALLAYLYQKDETDIDWVEIAFEFDFSDQPHLIRHLKKQLGQTPKNYAKERGFTIDVYGGVSS